jgi:hypothetical protein
MSCRYVLRGVQPDKSTGRRQTTDAAQRCAPALNSCSTRYFTGEARQRTEPCTAGGEALALAVPRRCTKVPKISQPELGVAVHKRRNPPDQEASAEACKPAVRVLTDLRPNPEGMPGEQTGVSLVYCHDNTL